MSEKAYVALKSRAKVSAPNFVAHPLAMRRESRVRVTGVEPGNLQAKFALRNISR